MIQLIISVRNDNPNTIWNRLAARLGRQPTHAEARAEVQRIAAEGMDEIEQRRIGRRQ